MFNLSFCSICGGECITGGWKKEGNENIYLKRIFISKLLKEESKGMLILGILSLLA
jgi:hypothetical protein